MDKNNIRPKKFLSVNLLPQEMLATKQAGANVSLIKRISVIVIIVVIGVTLAVTLIRFIQNQQANSAQETLTNTQNELSGLKDKEVLTLSLKERLDSLKALKEPNKQQKIFDLMIDLAPPELKLLSFNISPVGKVDISGETTDLNELHTFLDIVVDKDKTKNQIGKVKLENLNLGLDGTYRFDLNFAVN